MNVSTPRAQFSTSVFINRISATLFNFPDTYYIQKAQSKDPDSSKIIQDLLSKAMPPSEYSLENNLLLFRKLVMVPNKDLQLQITILFHNSLPAG
ncbi:hypothetical protein DSO57_1038617 [Entomophthora muscae]|uniref:Uncharacterized protein n=1 Tax=Entomophthora muscae TaxID=34485 RepID=A0ACC2SYV5_9FUNG|nr:hypothetical protein DSO57_1038617 [Entomophthora muscae]